MEPSCSSLVRDEPSVAVIKPYCELTSYFLNTPCLIYFVTVKLRLGGSRSVVTGKFLKDTLYNPSRRHDTNLTSLEPTRSLDNNSISSHSTDSSSLNQEKVRIMGRGGAGARRRNYTKTVPAPMIELRPLHAPETIKEPVVRNVGRGGLGSRPQGIRGKGKAVDTSHKRNKSSKQLRRSLSVDRELRSKSPESQISTISTIHFAGETGLPPPDFFKVTKKRSQQVSLPDTDEMDEEHELNRTFTPRNAPSAVPWDETPTTSQSNLASKAKVRRRERGFSLLLSVFQHDGSRKPDSGLSPPSMSIPSQITLTSIETDPSYFFHGPASRPSTPACGQETDSTTESSYTSLSSFQRESDSPSSLPSSKEVDDCQDDEPLVTTPQPDHGNYPPTRRREDLSVVPHVLSGMHLSAIEAEALGSPPCSPFLQENIPFVPSHPPKIQEVEEEEGPVSKPKSEESESWTGEWNTGMIEVIRALRELR